MFDSYSGQNLIFLVGCPRSGTTWLQRMLATHPKIQTGQESDLFALYVGPQLRAWRNNLDQSENARGGLGLACYHREAEFLDILRRYLDALLQPMVCGLAEGDLFLEKSPAHALYVGEILEMLPESRIIHLLRDPRDVVGSLLAASKGWGHEWAPREAGHATWTWLNHVRAARAAGAAARKDRFLEVTYESLHHDPFRELRRLLSFLGLNWPDDGIKRAIDANSPANTARTGGTAIRLHGEFGGVQGRVVSEPTGFIRNAKPGSWRTELSFRDRITIWRMARRQMRELGYRWPVPIG